MVPRTNKIGLSETKKPQRANFKSAIQVYLKKYNCQVDTHKKGNSCFMKKKEQETQQQITQPKNPFDSRPKFRFHHWAVLEV